MDWWSIHSIAIKMEKNYWCKPTAKALAPGCLPSVANSEGSLQAFSSFRFLTVPWRSGTGWVSNPPKPTFFGGRVHFLGRLTPSKLLILIRCFLGLGCFFYRTQKSCHPQQPHRLVGESPLAPRLPERFLPRRSTWLKPAEAPAGCNRQPEASLKKYHLDTFGTWRGMFPPWSIAVSRFFFQVQTQLFALVRSPKSSTRPPSVGLPNTCSFSWTFKVHVL